MIGELYPGEFEAMEHNGRMDALEQEPCEDAISRQAVLDAIAANCIWENEYNLTSSRIKKAVEGLPPVTPQPKTGQFAKWVAREIFDENWEYNKNAFAEIACRKLEKLGIVIRMGDEWVLFEPPERSDKE